jgi:hypothetical protein
VHDHKSDALTKAAFYPIFGSRARRERAEDLGELIPEHGRIMRVAVRPFDDKLMKGGRDVS